MRIVVLLATVLSACGEESSPSPMGSDLVVVSSVHHADLGADRYDVTLHGQDRTVLVFDTPSVESVLVYDQGQIVGAASREGDGAVREWDVAASGGGSIAYCDEACTADPIAAELLDLSFEGALPLPEQEAPVYRNRPIGLSQCILTCDGSDVDCLSGCIIAFCWPGTCF